VLYKSCKGCNPSNVCAIGVKELIVYEIDVKEFIVYETETSNCRSNFKKTVDYSNTVDDLVGVADPEFAFILDKDEILRYIVMETI